MKTFKDLGIKNYSKGFEGRKIEIHEIFNCEIIVNKYKVEDSKFPEKNYKKCLHMEIEYEGKKRVVFTGSKSLIDIIQQVPDDGFPFTTKIIKDNKRFQFT